MFGFGQLIDILKRTQRKSYLQRVRIHVSLRSLHVYLQATSYIQFLWEILIKSMQVLKTAVLTSVEQKSSIL